MRRYAQYLKGRDISGMGADSRLQAKIVRSESLAIDQQYEKKRKQAETGWKMYVCPLHSMSLRIEREEG